MRDTAELQLALTPPSTVRGAHFDPEARRLDIVIDFAPGSRLACPVGGAAYCPVYDAEQKTWCPLNFLQHEAYLTVRVRCDKCGIKTVTSPGLGLTAASACSLRQCLMAMIPAIPVAAATRMVGE